MTHSAQGASPDVVVTGRPLIAIVAGEASGDILGAGLIRAMRARLPEAQFVGIGGPEMIEQGFQTLVPMERLSVMGLVEVLGRLFELIGIRRRLHRTLLDLRPAVFIGIDAPDFTLGLELKLRQAGITTVHYVSPSVWAWRRRRVFKIARAVDLMLTLFPFEAKFYQEHAVPVRFVGHPLADRVPMQWSEAEARRALNLPEQGSLVAVLPGSRGSEIHFLGRIFIEAAVWLHRQRPDVHFVLPCINETRYAQVDALIREIAPELPVTLVLGQSRTAMAASDAILLASGTATLEAMLVKRPMVVAYRMAALTYWLASKLVKVPYISLPNLLANKRLVPEMIQHDASPEALGQELLDRLQDVQARKALEGAFAEIHQQLRQGADEQAADAVVSLIAAKRVR